MSDIKKVVLAYSGGLDTSVIVRWLQDEYNAEVVTFTADIGQGEEVEPARAKAEALGVKEIYIEDLREEFVRDYVFPGGLSCCLTLELKESLNKLCVCVCCIFGGLDWLLIE